MWFKIVDVENEVSLIFRDVSILGLLRFKKGLYLIVYNIVSYKVENLFLYFK